MEYLMKTEMFQNGMGFIFKAVNRFKMCLRNMLENKIVLIKHTQHCSWYSVTIFVKTQHNDNTIQMC